MTKIIFHETLRYESEKFNLSFKFNAKKQMSEFVIQSRIGGKHFASYNQVEFLDDDGSFLSKENITKPIADYIAKYFDIKGETDSFVIYRSDYENNLFKKRGLRKINPEDVRHKITNQEHSFTATGEKLAYHWPIFEKYKNTGFGSIVRATLTLHQVCSSHCNYCSTIARNRKDSISLQEAKDFVSKLYYDQAKFNKDNFKEYNDKYIKLTGSDIRLRGLILSGGGQPNLWPHFEEFVNWLSELEIDLGLITNGFPSKINESIYENFKWIRISITPEDASPHYPGNKFNAQYIPKTIINNPNITVGYSYVYGAWTDDDILRRIDKSIEENGFEYCRTLTDCNLTRASQLCSHRDLADKLFHLGFIDENGKPLKKIFHQLKYHGEAHEASQLWDTGQCQLQIYNVFWDTTGHEENGVSSCYACDSITVLAEENDDINIQSERKFNAEKWGLVQNNQVEKLYTEKVKPYFDPRVVCKACLFTRNNQQVKSYIQNQSFENIIINKEIKHVNFP